MRIGTFTAIVFLIAVPVAAQTSMTTAAKQTAATTAAPTVADPCAKAVVPVSKFSRVKLVSARAQQRVVLNPTPQPQIVMQNLDPIRAIDMAWTDASDQVMTLIKMRHELSESEVKDIQAFDDAHQSGRERFVFRMDLLTQTVEAGQP
jgi:hypothetical protein